MTRSELERYRQQLLGLAGRLRGDLANTSGEAFRQAGGEAAGNLSNVPTHPGDLGTANYEHEVAVSLVANERQLAGQVAAALDRIEQGTYGRCAECGREINPERLRTLPYAAHCIECAGKIQREVGREPGPDVT